MEEKTKTERVLHYSIFDIRYSIFGPRARRGFSLLELIIVIAIIAVLGTVGSGYYREFIKNVEIQSVSKILASDLRHARSKAMIGEDGFKWGAHIVNVNGGDQYYELFSTPTNYADASKSVISTTTLPTGVTFTNPGSGTYMDIIFSKISGTTTATTTSIVSEGNSSIINISSIGSIY